MIRFHCGCGKRLKVDDAFAGRQVKCGACGAKLIAPAAGEGTESPTPAAPPANGLDALAQALKAAPKQTAGALALQRLQGKKVPAARTTPVAAAKGAAIARGKRPANSGPSGRNAPPAALPPSTFGKNKVLFVGIGAAVVVVGAIVAIIVVTMGKPATLPPKVEKPIVIQKKALAPVVEKKPEVRAHHPGEMFANVPFVDETTTTGTTTAATTGK